MAVTYKDVVKARAEAIRLGIDWHTSSGDEKDSKFPDYYQAWLKYRAMDLELAKMEVEIL